jgi:hypothetical protein
MTPRAAAIGIGVLTLLALGLLAAAMRMAGGSPPIWIGLFVGVALGGLNLLFESLSLTWALRKEPSAMLFVSLGGFGLRLVLVCVLTIVFANTKSVSAASFALSYVGSFLAYLILQVWVVTRMKNGSMPPQGTGDGEPGSREGARTGGDQLT